MLLPGSPEGTRTLVPSFMEGTEIYSTTSQKGMDGFTQHLVDRLGVTVGRIDSILVKIRI